MRNYKKRIVDQALSESLSVMGAVVVEGAKWCGKTTTSEQAATSRYYIDEEGRTDGNILLARTAPERILSGAMPRLVDEWQLAPSLWDAIRFRVDRSDGTGAFILTGSSVPPDSDEMRHSGAGRFSWLRMRPMTLWESGDSTGGVSLAGLFSGEIEDGAPSSGRKLDEIAYLACRGGWPKVSSLHSEAALDVAFAYLDAVVRRDISRADGVNRDEDRARRLIRSYARLQGTQSSASAICADLAANEPRGFGEATVCAYLNALKRIFTVEDMAAWCPNLRSKATVRTSDTRYFVDPSIAAAALGLGPSDLMDDLATFGLVFETMAVRDLRVYAQALHGAVFHYRDANGLECDAVIHLRNGRYGLVELKLGGKELVDKGASSLKKLAGIIDTGKMRQPSFLAVVTAVGDFAYRRDDGVCVIPLGALRP
ncbi:MAG: ATP-binding protein [Kiritimatiellae bacterium]|nr:ATP-binding protein [Kiritimatiellia bacterium]